MSVVPKILMMIQMTKAVKSSLLTALDPAMNHQIAEKYSTYLSCRFQVGIYGCFILL